MKNQSQRVYDYMLQFGSITSLEAVRDLGVISLPKRICELTAEGIQIAKKRETVANRYGEKISIVRYSLAESS